MDAMTEMLKGLKINDAGYYDSDENDAECDPASDPKADNRTSDEKKNKSY